MAIEESKHKIYTVLAAIPTGKVATYGQIATLAGLSGRARLVGTTLSQLPVDTELPWHRVVNAVGKISLAKDSHSYKIQKARLQNEGIAVINDRVRLQIYGWVV